jgi:hypothetical protein
MLSKTHFDNISAGSHERHPSPVAKTERPTFYTAPEANNEPVMPLRKSLELYERFKLLSDEGREPDVNLLLRRFPKMPIQAFCLATYAAQDAWHTRFEREFEEAESGIINLDPLARPAPQVPDEVERIVTEWCLEKGLPIILKFH